MNNQIYAIGGQDNGNYLSTVEVYEPFGNTWTTRTPMPTARDSLAVGVLNIQFYGAQFYAIGGRGNETINGILGTTEQLNPSFFSPKLYLLYKN